LVCLLCVSGSEGQLTPAHDILFWDQVIETDQSRFSVLGRILVGSSVISIHAKPFDSDLFSGAEFEKCSPICQRRTVKHENRPRAHAPQSRCPLHRKRESQHCVNQTTAHTSTEPPRNANVSDAMGGGVYVGEALA
jgi:hypothetical protein